MRGVRGHPSRSATTARLAFVLQVHVFSTIDRLMNPEHRERKLELSTTQITGSALAAMSGAFFASWAGTTGTIVGAAVGSVIVTVGAATYTWSLQRTRDAVKRTAAQVRAVDGRMPSRRSDPSVEPGNLPWGKVALTSVAVMALGLGGITAIEAATGKPVSSYTGSSDSTGTTLGNAIGSSDSKSAPAGLRDLDRREERLRHTDPDEGLRHERERRRRAPGRRPPPRRPRPPPPLRQTPRPRPTPPASDPVTPTPDPRALARQTLRRPAAVCERDVRTIGKLGQLFLDQREWIRPASGCRPTSDETERFRFIHVSDDVTGGSMNKLASSATPRRGCPRGRDPRRHPRAAARGRLRPVDDGRRRQGLPGEQGHPLPPLGDQAQPRRRRDGARQAGSRHRRRSTPARCAATCSPPSAGRTASTATPPPA